LGLRACAVVTAMLAINSWTCCNLEDNAGDWSGRVVLGVEAVIETTGCFGRGCSEEGCVDFCVGCNCWGWNLGVEMASVSNGSEFTGLRSDWTLAV